MTLQIRQGNDLLLIYRQKFEYLWNLVLATGLRTDPPWILRPTQFPYPFYRVCVHSSGLYPTGSLPPGFHYVHYVHILLWSQALQLPHFGSEASGTCIYKVHSYHPGQIRASAGQVFDLRDLEYLHLLLCFDQSRMLPRDQVERCSASFLVLSTSGQVRFWFKWNLSFLSRLGLFQHAFKCHRNSSLSSCHHYLTYALLSKCGERVSALCTEHQHHSLSL